MITTLRQAFRLGLTPCLSLTGAGGKSTSLFRLAREFSSPVVLGSTAHLALEQAAGADRHFILRAALDIPDEAADGVSLFTGEDNGKGRWGPVPNDCLLALQSLANRLAVPLLFESDGSRCLPVKAWEKYEPPIPDFVDTVVVCAGLSALGRPLDEKNVFRAQLFAQLSGLSIGETLTPEALAAVLANPAGGLKNIPPNARIICLLNQADTPALQAQAMALGQMLPGSFSAVVIAALKPGGLPLEVQPCLLVQNGFKGIHAVLEPAGGVVLAAGGAARMGQTKLLLPWRGEPLIRHSARTALQAGLDPVIVVTGANAPEISNALEGLPVKLAFNPDWQNGQSTSVKCGLAALPPQTGSALFLLGDQPQIPVTLIRALLEKHQTTLAPITCPLIGQQRANPVLFDRVTFADFSSLTGDSGARQIFSRYPLDYLPWHDQNLLLDVDTPADFNRLQQI